MKRLPINTHLEFGPYSRPFLLAHRHTTKACGLVYGDKEMIEESGLDLSEFSVFTMPANSTCEFFHHRTGNNRCRFRLVQVTDQSLLGAQFQPQNGVEQPLDPPPPPTQECLCPQGTFTCPPGSEPDCSSGACEVALVVPEECP